MVYPFVGATANVIANAETVYATSGSWTTPPTETKRPFAFPAAWSNVKTVVVPSAVSVCFWNSMYSDYCTI